MIQNINTTIWGTVWYLLSVGCTHTQSTSTVKKKTLAPPLLLFLFGMHSVGGGLCSALLVVSCVHQRCDPSASSSVFLRPWHALAPGNERGAAWRTSVERLRPPPPAVYSGRWTKCPLSVERKRESVYFQEFLITTYFFFNRVNSFQSMGKAWLFKIQCFLY